MDEEKELQVPEGESPTEVAKEKVEETTEKKE